MEENSSFFSEIVLDETRNLAFIATKEKGVSIYDISNIKKPSFLKHLGSKNILNYSLS